MSSNNPLSNSCWEVPGKPSPELLAAQDRPLRRQVRR